MLKHHEHIQKRLKEREAKNALRELNVNYGLVDFCSNDYLGFAKEKSLHQIENIEQFGSTGSRLISGNNLITEKVETYLANFYKAESALIFNSGYSANLGLFSCVPQKGDTVIYDELIHASIRDGVRLSNANSFSFKHNDVESLKSKLERAEGNVFVVVESIYSMDGDEAPVEEIIKLSKQFNFALIVDEAHAVGVVGEGRGLVSELNFEQDIFARVVTFGKALGIHGAVVLGSNNLRRYLINFSRPLIYTTALPIPSIISIEKAHEFLIANSERINKLKGNIKYFVEQIQHSNLNIQNSQSAIQCIVVSGNDEVKNIASKIQNEGFDVRPILSPTVPHGQERIRICLHSFNTKEEINQLVEAIK